jgi:hypothetical protein
MEKKGEQTMSLQPDNHKLGYNSKRWLNAGTVWKHKHRWKSVSMAFIARW